MEQSFRSAVFQLCKKYENNPKANEIRELIHYISVVTRSAEEENDTFDLPPHGDFAYIASHHNIQFLGYLITDESVDEYNKQAPFHLTGLDEDERRIIETGHKTIISFIDACLAELKDKHPQAYMMVNPYYAYKSPKLKAEAESLFSDDELSNCVEAFKRSKPYRKIVENDTLYILDSVSKDNLLVLASVIEKQFRQDYSELSEETQEMLLKLNTSNPKIPDLVLAYCVYCYSLQRALSNAVQLLFEALLGKPFVVLNNDNIIDYEHRRGDLVYERYTILSQDMFFSNPDIGSVVLLSCDVTPGTNIKEFGCVYSETISFSQEFGSSIKVSFVTVDDDLNPIHLATDYIINSRLGRMPVKLDKGK